MQIRGFPALLFAMVFFCKGCNGKYLTKLVNENFAIKAENKLRLKLTKTSQPTSQGVDYYF